MCEFLSLVESDRHAFYLFTPEQRIAHRKKPLTDKHGNALKMDSHASICAFYRLDEDVVNKYEWNPYTRKLHIDRREFDVDEARVLAYLDGLDLHTICGDIEGLRAFCDRMKDVPFFKRCGSLPDGVKLFATRTAARAAARDSAWDAANAAASAAALDAAMAAARDSAWDAARAAASTAARDAARAAARDAAWDAAASAAARVSANAAASAAAWAAASAAASAAAWAADSAAALYARIIFLCAGLEIDKKHVDYIKKRWEVWEAGYGVLCDIDGVLYCYEKL